MVTFNFSRLDQARLDEAFQIFQQVGQHLSATGSRQRIGQTTRADYQSWQDEKANYIVTTNSVLDSIQIDPIVGVVTLRQEVLVQWPNQNHLGQVSMLRGLAIHPDYQGQRVGTFAVEQLLKCNPDCRPVFLDCVVSSLPGFYETLGFEAVDRQLLKTADIGALDICLMKLS